LFSKDEIVSFSRATTYAATIPMSAIGAIVGPHNVIPVLTVTYLRATRAHPEEKGIVTPSSENRIIACLTSKVVISS
jgi:hypothetical protein